MEIVAFIVGAAMCLTVTADLTNTLVTTRTSSHPWWLSRRYYRVSWAIVRRLGKRLSPPLREALFTTYAPLSILGLLTIWVAQQVLGFGLMWWAIDGVEGASSLVDSIYYSGVVYFTLGFGEIVPATIVPRFGALMEAFTGVLTTALVIGYLPALYSAYSERERRLLTLDDGSEERITPDSLLISRCPECDLTGVLDYFKEWEDWIAGVIETHSTFPMLVFFRSKDPGQHWVTALGLITDTALQAQMIRGAENRQPYWLIRRSIRLFDQLTRNADLSEYRAEQDKLYAGTEAFRDLYDGLAAQGFDLVDFETARSHSITLRRRYDAAMEYLIDNLEAPHGFWGHSIGHTREAYAPGTTDGTAPLDD